MPEIKIDNEFKSLIPPLSSEEYTQLENNLLSDGCRDPLVIWTDTNTIIDGHNRFEICSKHNLSFQKRYMQFESRDKATEWIILNQFGRRNLSNYDRSILALKLKPIIEEKAKGNIRATQNNESKTAFQKSDKQIHTDKELAKVAGVSHDTIHKVEKIESKATPEVKQKVKSGEISINQAYQAVRKEEKIEAVNEKVVPATVESKSIDIFNTDKKYSIIYADPAWTYGDWENGLRNPKTQYTCMSTEDIGKLPVNKIADDNCILFMWATYPLLPEGLEVIKQWGFTYKTVGFVWIKKNKSGDGNFFGCGNWTRANSEICIIAAKGIIQRMDASISQIVESPIEEHSKKPDAVRELITRLVGELPRIELFSRQCSDGWDCWGNEI